MAHALIGALGRQSFEFKASLNYIVSSMTARVTRIIQSDPVLKKRREREQFSVFSKDAFCIKSIKTFVFIRRRVLESSFQYIEREAVSLTSYQFWDLLLHLFFHVFMGVAASISCGRIV